MHVSPYVTQQPACLAFLSHIALYDDEQQPAKVRKGQCSEHAGLSPLAITSSYKQWHSDTGDAEDPCVVCQLALHDTVHIFHHSI